MNLQQNGSLIRSLSQGCCDIWPRKFSLRLYDIKTQSFLGRRCYSIGDLLPSLCLSVCRVVYCGQTVQDRPIVCIEVEWECGDEISIGTIFDPLAVLRADAPLFANWLVYYYPDIWVNADHGIWGQAPISIAPNLSLTPVPACAANHWLGASDLRKQEPVVDTAPLFAFIRRGMARLSRHGAFVCKFRAPRNYAVT